MQTVEIDAPTIPIERPLAPEWGSDVVAEMLRRLGVEYAALNPGASFRGLHDSLVNYNGNRDPQMAVCNHEEVAVAVAHGYAKASGRPMAAIVHSNVGLLHAAMAVFNAWVDRAPLYLLGATGPMDSTRRRPWIDWIHTSQGQGQVIRDFTKWEHQPASVAAIPEAMLRAWRAMLTEPRGPVYICLDAGLQEQQLDPTAPIDLPDPAAYRLPAPIQPDAGAVDEAARLLVGADFPVILAGRGCGSEAAWKALVALAEALGAAVLTDLKAPAAFPTNHPLHQCTPGGRLDAGGASVLRQADVVLSLDWIDPAGTLRGDGPGAGSSPKLISVSLDDYALRSWAADQQELPATAVSILAGPEPTLGLLVPAVERLLADNSGARTRGEQRSAAHRARRAELDQAAAAERSAALAGERMGLSALAVGLSEALGSRRDDVTLIRVPIKWQTGCWDFTKPGAFLGGDGGAGLGSGPGLAVGAALALRGSGRLPVAILGDGDTLMASSALWTAAHLQVPVLIVVANNQTYFNDEEHQERVARVRARPVENRWVGQRMDQPPVDFAGLARAMGVEGFGPVSEPSALVPSLAEALRAVDAGRPVLVDVTVR
jgi:thiamine pyrophosphate-dependent acetolactate synthase large subunit-like protein